MALLVTDPDLESRILSQRQNSGGDRFDEVWDGLYIARPLVDNEHQELLTDFVCVLVNLFGWDSPVKIRPGVNVSDRNEDWAHNYRCPDVVVFLPGNPAINRDTHWQGGPDFLVEIVIHNDRSHEKIPFYASVGVREVLLIDRNPWRLELYVLDEPTRSLRLTGTSTLTTSEELRSAVLPVTFQIVLSHDRPGIKISFVQPAASTTSGRTSWLI